MTTVSAQRLYRERQYGGRDIHRGPDGKVIWEPPPQISPRRRKCRNNLQLYLETYHSRTFALAWSPSHLQLIGTIQEIMIGEGLVVVAMPRGSGKTNILVRSILWAALYGHTRFAFLASADDFKARRELKKIKQELENNEALYRDFPEICHPARRLDRSPTRAIYQEYDGQSTHMEWSSNHVVFPRIPASIKQGNDGCVIAAGGIESAVRGANVTLSDGTTIRPDKVFVDDPQTKRSAKSDLLVADREELICNDLINLAGPGKPMSVMVALTTLREGDVACRLLDHLQHPEWKRIRVKMLLTWPQRMDLWHEYAERRRICQANNLSMDAVNQFYAQHRAEMDAGAEVYWESRVDRGCLSALQSAMNRHFDNPSGFACEFQNEPLDPLATDATVSLTISDTDIDAMVGDLPQGQSHSEALYNVAMVDVSQDILWWMVSSVMSDFRVAIIDHGTWPPQNGAVSASNVRRTLRSLYGLPMEQSITAGLTELTNNLMQRTWPTAGGVSIPVMGGVVDSKWGVMTHAIRQWCWKSTWKHIWLPSEGIAKKASSPALNDTKRAKKTREVRGHHWREIPEKEGKRLLLDTNIWKSFVASLVKDRKVAVHSGDRKTLWQIYEHLTAEYAVKVESTRTIEEWNRRADRSDEHQWDNLVGCCVRANMLGMSLPGQVLIGPAKRKRVSFSDRARKSTDCPHGQL